MKAPDSLVIADREVALRVRRNGLAKRMSLRLDTIDGTVVVVLPQRVSVAEGLRFANQQTEWLARRLAALPPRVAFVDGAMVPILGQEVVLRHRPGARRGVWREGDELHASGGADHMTRRVRDWLCRHARAELAAAARALAPRIGRTAGRISVRDTRSRWGSCSSAGDLSFSWRLVLAPRAIMDYVVAHEVAHLAEMNHGPRFWALVDELIGGDGGEAARRWLKQHGPGLHRYG